jgi:hypothetical protein
MAHKNLWCHEKSWIAMKICDILLPNGMACHHCMEDQVVINHNGQHLDGCINILKKKNLSNY